MSASRLPVEIWRQIFWYLLPVHELSRVFYEHRDEPAQCLRFAASEDPQLADTVQCLVSCEDLLFPSSHKVYWEVLIPNVKWTIGSSPQWVSGGYVGSLEMLDGLQEEYGVPAKHVIVVVDSSRREEWVDVEEYTPARLALSDARDVADYFEHLKTLDFYIDIYARSPEHGRWMDDETVWDLLRCLYTRDGWQFEDWRKEFVAGGGKVRFWTRTAIGHVRGFECSGTIANDFSPAITEDITACWEDILLPDASSRSGATSCESFSAAMSVARQRYQT